jgi:hypothetical protein
LGSKTGWRGRLARGAEAQQTTVDFETKLLGIAAPLGKSPRKIKSDEVKTGIR